MALSDQRSLKVRCEEAYRRRPALKHCRAHCVSYTKLFFSESNTKSYMQVSTRSGSWTVKTLSKAWADTISTSCPALLWLNTRPELYRTPRIRQAATVKHKSLITTSPHWWLVASLQKRWLLFKGTRRSRKMILDSKRWEARSRKSSHIHWPWPEPDVIHLAQICLVSHRQLCLDNILFCDTQQKLFAHYTKVQFSICSKLSFYCLGKGSFYQRS